jgi:hypothetical protein
MINNHHNYYYKWLKNSCKSVWSWFGIFLFGHFNNFFVHGFKDLYGMYQLRKEGVIHF